MRTTWLQSIGLLSLGFLLGIIVSGLRPTAEAPRHGSRASGEIAGQVYSFPRDYRLVSRVGVWDVLASDIPGEIALGQAGQVRVNVLDDVSALYVHTWRDGQTVWDGRLMDVGNDGTVEVADLSFGHCEAFEP